MLFFLLQVYSRGCMTCDIATDPIQKEMKSQLLSLKPGFKMICKTLLTNFFILEKIVIF